MRPIGIQLYTLRKPFAKNPLRTLEQIKAAGYDSVEFAAPLDADFAGFAARMRDVGLDCPSAHVGLADMAERPDAVMAMAKTLGCRFIVMPYVTPEQRDWKNVVSVLTAFAKRAKDEGVRTAYHHHNFEFEASDGARPFDILVSETDPALVFFELDVYWLKVGGEDPKAVMDAMKDRVKLIHLKDWKPDGSMTDVGSGALDMPALIAAAEKAGAEYFFVEHDFPPEPFWPSVEASLAYLRRVG
ncbi:MAG: TIM barrel protein [Alphaproteobacteria bacterium]|nr:TIM barrel protein [Alphaproteobacteria bacterium]